MGDPMDCEPLFAVFPEWRALARTEIESNGSEYVVIQVAAPPEADVEHGLHIDTANDEISVGFDVYLQHFGDWAGESSSFGTDSALEFVQQLVEERVAVVSWWHDERWRGSSLVNAGESPKPGSYIDTYTRVRVRSWRGTLNVDTTD